MNDTSSNLAPAATRAHRLRARVKSMPVFALLIVAVVVVISIGADLITQTVIPEPEAIDLRFRYTPPWPMDGSSATHLLGTDQLGRDLLSRMIKGAQTSLLVALTCIFIAASAGTLLGLISGYWGGWVDTAIMRLVDAMLAFPAILVALVLVVTVGASFGMIVFTIAFLMWAPFARVVRGEVLSVKERNFVALSRIAGASAPRVLFFEILPNIINTVVVMATLQVGSAIVVESSLSFLGAGIPPPEPTWGNLVAEGRNVMDSAWWVSTFPGIAILLVVLSFNLLGDWLRDTLDPNLRTL